MNIISIILIAFIIGNEDLGAIHVIIIITLILDIALVFGTFTLILAATRGVRRNKSIFFYS